MNPDTTLLQEQRRDGLAGAPVPREEMEAAVRDLDMGKSPDAEQLSEEQM